MHGWKTSVVAAAVLCGATASRADPPQTALSCKGDAVRDSKAFNVPAKTESEVRIYVLDETKKAVLKIVNGEPVPVCDASKPACHADFVAAGVKISFQDGDDSLQLIYNRKASTLGEQAENAVMTVTFEGKCQLVDPATTLVPR